MEDTYRTKVGFRKIQFCIDQASKDDLSFIRVDTCCIDKSSSAELTEAINSMFAWYRDSARCYVYLPDVLTSNSTKEAPSYEAWIVAFQQSRWFTRGWTLQELIAPALAEFFSGEGQRLGDRSSMVQELYHITGISVDALLRSPIHGFSVQERMSWLGQRKTKREEDLAYLMLGIFDVHMPLIYGEGRKKAFARLHKKISAQKVDERTAPRMHEPFSTVPFSPDADYVDRPEILEWVCDKCARASGRAALVGLGGVGESQLAIQYAYRVRDTAPGTYVFWVHASTQAQFKEAYRGLADRLELPKRLDPKVDVLRLVSDWLCDERNGQWLMVVDNVDDLETFFPSQPNEQEGAVNESAPLAAYLPQSRSGSILFTSRNRDVAARLAGGYHNIKEVLAMDESQGLNLLRNKLVAELYEEPAAVQLLHTLDFMPLAITQAAAYIGRRARMTITGYLSEFHANGNRRESLLHQDAGDLRRDMTASNSVVTTWQISFERIRQERSSATELLSLMSFFNPQGIPEQPLRMFHRWYHRDAERVGESGDEDEAARRMFDEDLDTLHAYSLVKVARTTMPSDDETLEMHSLVQFCTQVWLKSSGEADKWKGTFIEVLAKDFPIGEYENWKQCERLLPHASLLYSTERLHDKQLIEPWIRVLTRTAWYICLRGNYQTAQVLASRAVAAQEHVLSLDNCHARESISVLAMALRYQEKFEEAARWTRQVLEWQEKKLGSDSNLSYMTGLADALDLQGKCEEAEKLYRRALEESEKELGLRHPSTLAIVTHLASVVLTQGRFEEAEKLNWRALEGREKELGSHHPYTLLSMSNLAWLFCSQGRYDEAKNMAQRALEGREKELGMHHPDTMLSLNVLASTLHQTGDYKESETLFHQALGWYEKELGVHHRFTLTIVNNLSWLLRDLKKYKESEELNRRAMEGREKVLGAHHIDTITSVHSLGYLLHIEGRHEEAAPLYQRAYGGFLQEYGPQDIRTAACSRNMQSIAAGSKPNSFLARLRRVVRR